MRIIAGQARGRILKSPTDKAIRPTGDKIRGAIFNMLFSRGVIDGAVVIDAFCGTGALGLEALSRGALSCTFMDNSRTSLALARENAVATGLDTHSLFLSGDATKPGPRPAHISPATLVFLDPPYNKNLAEAALQALAQEHWLAPGASCVIETEKKFSAPWPPGFTEQETRVYGDTKIHILRVD